MSDPWKSEGWQRARQDYHAGRARTTSPRRASGNNHAPKPEPSNGELDAAAVKVDDRNETDAEIRRLAKLTPIEYDRERRSAAQKLGIDRVSVLDGTVKAARGENAETKGQGRPLEMPTIEPWPECVNGADLLNAICNAVKRYLVVPEGSAEVLALWAIHTHAFECFTHSPRLAITSPEKQCGKTTTLDVLRELVARPLPTSNATTAAVFRTIEMATPTLLIDEADTFLRENEELRGVLNSGHRQGGQIIRTVGEDHEPRQFATWAPAAIAMIGRLSDTLEDRSVSIALRRRRPTEKLEQFRSDQVQDLKQLTRKIARWCDDNRQRLAASDPHTGTLANRAADNWRPLFSIADLAGGSWPERARAVAEVAETTKQDQSKRTMVLGDIRDLFAARGTDRLRSAEIVEALGAMETRPEWRNGKPITPVALGRLLGPFSIVPDNQRHGDSISKGYLLTAFEEAFATYLPPQPATPLQRNNDGHFDTFQAATPENNVAASKSKKPNNDGRCSGVAGQNPPTDAKRCEHCNQPGVLQECHYGEDADAAWLHRECEEPWQAAYEERRQQQLQARLPSLTYRKRTPQPLADGSLDAPTASAEVSAGHLKRVSRTMSAYQESGAWPVSEAFYGGLLWSHG
jgi:putative DNA primase/helicase